ncbi:SPOR domain-containing protein [Flavobacterium subsaxonicum]|uniref:Sporulation protein n=1 Tax=Flavobacterium subsaxonicum WB 4.1-42 = DSM 21790 TaxID=1121898 RepID=A0A0A2MRG2_9FLAO|nr:SPOR domain-containing protein [Flavobacterium subsaxonicum]KGO94063.1 sporulation protein [Flavobacterium subsaxonicum WB 4.1-42 = DSM 21790]
MRILRITPLHFAVLFCTVMGGSAMAQTNTVTVSQDAKFEELLNEKRKINSSITVNDRYKLQIFYGANDKARKALQDFKRDFKDLDGTIVFESPTYKVWVGSFSSRMDAERKLSEVRKKYPNALLVKPNK